ncbi:hypothetical protein OS493_009846 [Desmophyllum pertusum]|uniref:Secreted protein n=1 Tax=Desmophyllum pertusum TaxID=174260 RepID=A0A9X0CNA0_9CNID|nr:hypothetical protein OS493_009846 [Desmophyllum pertusum]
MIMPSEIGRRKILNHSVAVLLIAGFLVLASSSHSGDKEDESEAELEHKARIWIDALIDGVAQKHAQGKKNFQKSLAESGQILIE